MNQMVSLLSEY